MNDKYSTTEGKTSEKLSDEAMLSAQWKSIDWHKAEREVNRLQIRIVKATQQKDYNAVKRLQYLLTHSFYAKALAVKRVVTNDGRRTPGVDGVLWNTPAKKMAAALSLTDKRYRARPLRRVYIEKKDKKKKRPLGIPTMYDRAMQALYALALEPVAETTADGKSFGFRKGRCAQDACEYLFNALSRKHISPKWVLEGDIKGCFDHISHDWLLANIPMDKNILKQFLKAGFIYQRELFPTEEGTPQGGIISPILANMTLDGIEKKLVERFHTNALGKVDLRFKNRVHPQRRYGEQESRTFLQGAQRTGACAAGQHCKNGSRYKCPDASCGSASSGCRLASVGYDSAQWQNHPPRQSKQTSVRL